MLDEADRLLDLGFQAKLKEIISLLDRRSGKEPAVGEKRQREDGEEEQEDTAQHHTEEGEGRRRTVLLSATLHQQLGELATAIQHDPVPVGFVVKKVSRLEAGRAGGGMCLAWGLLWLNL